MQINKYTISLILTLITSCGKYETDANKSTGEYVVSRDGIVETIQINTGDLTFRHKIIDSGKTIIEENGNIIINKTGSPQQDKITFLNFTTIIPAWAEGSINEKIVRSKITHDKTTVYYSFSELEKQKLIIGHTGTDYYLNDK